MNYSGHEDNRWSPGSAHSPRAGAGFGLWGGLGTGRGVPGTTAGPVSLGLCHHGGEAGGDPRLLSLLRSHLSILAGGALPQIPAAGYRAGALLVKLGALRSQTGPLQALPTLCLPLLLGGSCRTPRFPALHPTLRSPYPKSPSPAPHSTAPHISPSHCPIPRHGVIP